MFKGWILKIFSLTLGLRLSLQYAVLLPLPMGSSNKKCEFEPISYIYIYIYKGKFHTVQIDLINKRKQITKLIKIGNVLPQNRIMGGSMVWENGGNLKISSL